MAVNDKNVDMVRLLLKSGADANATDNRGGTMFHVLAKHAVNNLKDQEENEIIMEIMKSKEIGISHLYRSLVTNGKLDIIDEIIQLITHKGADFEREDNDGSTPLKLALFESENIIAGLALKKAGATPGNMSIEEVGRLFDLGFAGGWYYGESMQGD